MYRPLPRTIPTLDGLRGLAALAVLVSHSANAGFLPAVLGGGFGHVSVGVFFTLSGFLMAHVCFGKPFNRGEISQYLVARGSRVLPMFYVVVVVSVALLATIGAGFYGIVNWHRAAFNLLLLRGDGVLWSVPVEVQCYLIFLAVWRAQARGHIWPLVLLLSLAAIVSAYLWAGSAWGVGYVFLWLHFFLIGAALRHLLDDGARNRMPASLSGSPAMALGLVALAMALLLPPDLRAALGWHSPEPFLDPFVILAMPMLLWASCAGAGPMAALAAPSLRWLGAISFSLYLLHAPIIFLVERLHIAANAPPFARFALVLAASLLASWITYRLIERPAQGWLRARYSASSQALSPVP
ncbi:acyltransferase family protein [Tsuneonella mangrovi]|uniref:acyltransferase family protein n=1 Tax=Tsuneonella mangrovi TaxID=1982042 RepID=UPI000BA1D86B|nr:acyltransferase [Tsuneonella mangrovi]